MFTCELCQRSKIPDHDATTVKVSATYGPGEGAKRLCSQCFNLFWTCYEVIKYVPTPQMETPSLNNIGAEYCGAIMDFILQTKQHFNEFSDREPPTAHQHPECLFLDCTRSADVRGLCKVHYNETRISVKDGTFTWDDLVKRGKALPTQRRRNRRQLTNWLSK